MTIKKSKTKFTTLFVLLIAASLVLSACSGFGNNNDEALTASGTISAKEVKISPEIGGKVKEVKVEEGDTVSAGDVLFVIDDELLQAQYNQAKASVEAADSSVKATEAQLASARSQYELTLQSVRMAEKDLRANEWRMPQPDEIDLPVWYYQKNEKISALEEQMDAAQAELQSKKEHLFEVLQNASNQDFLDVEKRLAESQAAFIVAKTTLIN